MRVQRAQATKHVMDRAFPCLMHAIQAHAAPSEESREAMPKRISRERTQNRSEIQEAFESGAQSRHQRTRMAACKMAEIASKPPKKAPQMAASWAEMRFWEKTNQPHATVMRRAVSFSNPERKPSRSGQATPVIF